MTPYRRLRYTVLNGPSQVTPSRTLHATLPSPTLRLHKTYRSNAARPMPASRAPRALRRADVESAWQGMHSSTAVSGGGVCWMIMPDNTSVNSRDDRPFCRVRCSCFCRAVSCHSCFLSIPARAMLSFLPCGVVPLVPVCAMLPSLCCACRCTRPAMTRVLLGRGRGREAHVVGGRREQVMFVRAARSTCGWGSPCGRHCVCEAGGGARRQAGAYSVRPLNSWPSRGA